LWDAQCLGIFWSESSETTHLVTPGLKLSSQLNLPSSWD
jgi:hypothetical protein